jgi:hypothetical protein
MIEQSMDINTADGQMETFLCHPERGRPYPDRIGAAASIYGARLVSDAEESPHLFPCFSSKWASA